MALTTADFGWLTLFASAFLTLVAFLVRSLARYAIERSLTSAKIELEAKHNQELESFRHFLTGRSL